MSTTTTTDVRANATSLGSPPAVPRRRLRPHERVAGPVVHVKTTLDAGESLWTPVLMLAGGYAITIPAFLVMWGASTLAVHLVASG